MGEKGVADWGIHSRKNAETALENIHREKKSLGLKKKGDWREEGKTNNV